MDSALQQIQDLQLEQELNDHDLYESLTGIRMELETGKELIKGRLDLIARVDASPYGWQAGAIYNSMKEQAKQSGTETAELWAKCEQKAAASATAKKASTYQQKAQSSKGLQPFRQQPAGGAGYSGRYQPRDKCEILFLLFSFSQFLRGLLCGLGLSLFYILFLFYLASLD